MFNYFSDFFAVIDSYTQLQDTFFRDFCVQDRLSYIYNFSG